MNQIAFLFGAGVSQGADMPSTSELTSLVLGRERMVWSPTGACSPRTKGLGSPDPERHPERVISFLELLSCKIEQNLRRKANYEDLYYVVSQIYEDHAGDHDNPVVLSFVREITEQVEPLTRYVEGVGISDMLSLCWKAKCYIESLVSNALSSDLHRSMHLPALVAALDDPGVSAIDVFSLNHDCLLEEFFREQGVECCDGFSDYGLLFRRWNPQLFDQATARVRLFKLHGSVNWFQFVTNRNGHKEERWLGYCQPGKSFNRLTNSTGYSITHASVTPVMLLGTFNKMLRYTSGAFADLFFRFHRELSKHGFLVVAGYGFGDKGINTRLIEWLDEDASRRMVVVAYPDCRTVLRNARRATALNWLRFVENGRLVTVKSEFANVNWGELKWALGSTLDTGRFG